MASETGHKKINTSLPGPYIAGVGGGGAGGAAAPTRETLFSFFLT